MGTLGRPQYPPRCKLGGWARGRIGRYAGERTLRGIVYEYEYVYARTLRGIVYAFYGVYE